MQRKQQITMNRIKHIVFLLQVLLMASCHAQTPASRPVEKKTQTYIDANGNRQLTMPQLPAGLQDVESRASFLAQHYWTNLSFADTLVLHDADFMEQTFVNFLSVLPMAREKESLAGIDSLWTGVQADTLVCNRLMGWAEKYLYDPNSPMLNENAYNLFLQVMLPTVAHDPVLADKLSFHKKVTETNRVGRLANNFYYQNVQGRHSLLDVEAPYTLLLFFDPDCGHCNEYLAALKASQNLEQTVRSGKLKVLAIYAEPHADGYRKALQKLPASWLNGYDADDVIQSSGLYFLRAMPTLILLDERKTVLFKDCTPEDVEQFASSLLY